MADATLKDIYTYFGYPNLGAFSADWKALSEKDRMDIKTGISNGTFTY